MLCHECNSEMIESRVTYHYIESGLDNVYLEGIYTYTCGCGESFPTIPNIVELQKVIGRAIINKQGSLNGNEVRFLRKNMGLMAKDLTGYLGVDKSTVSRWENGKKPLSKSNDKFIRLLYASFQGAKQHEIKELLEKSGQEFENKKLSELIRIPPGVFTGLQELCR
jgi:putative zinc finger/helix-turn-helix YgiT family protein